MNISFRPLGSSWTGRYLSDIAGLIYDTDPYIYPAMFSSREDAVHIIPKMIMGGDNMFSPNNLFIAEANDSVIGIILWHRGGLEWNDRVYRESGGHSPYIDEVNRRYFSSYKAISSDTVSILNVCTSVRGKGVGGKILDVFINETPGPYELYVLADNEAAIELYKKKGFTITEELQGFSIPPKDLPCYKMERL